MMQVFDTDWFASSFLRGCLLAVLAIAMVQARSKRETLSSAAFPSLAFSFSDRSVLLVVDQAIDTLPAGALKLAGGVRGQLPYGELFSVPEGVGPARSKVRVRQKVWINLTGDEFVRVRVERFLFNKTLYQNWWLAEAMVEPDEVNLYREGVAAGLSAFLARPSYRGQNSLPMRGSLRGPAVAVSLSSSQDQILRADLNRRMSERLQALRQSATPAQAARLETLLHGGAQLKIEVQALDFGGELGVRQHVLGTWSIDAQPVFTLQGYKVPSASELELVEGFDGGSLAGDELILGALDDWDEETGDDFEVANVFSGGWLLRRSSGYEHSEIYLQQWRSTGNPARRHLYGA